MTGREPRASLPLRPRPSPGSPIRSMRWVGRAPSAAISRARRGLSTPRASSRLCFSPPGWRGPKFCSISATPPGPARCSQAALADAPGDPRAQLLMDELSSGRATSRRCRAVRRSAAGPGARPRSKRLASWRGRSASVAQGAERKRAPTQRRHHTIPDEPRLFARAALLLAQLGAVDQAPLSCCELAGGPRRRCRRSPGQRPRSRSDGGGRSASDRPSPGRPETALLVARAALAAGGVGALGAALGEVGRQRPTETPISSGSDGWLRARRDSLSLPVPGG